MLKIHNKSMQCVLSHVQLFVIPWTISLPDFSCPCDLRGKNPVVGCHFLLNNKIQWLDNSHSDTQPSQPGQSNLFRNT